MITKVVILLICLLPKNSFQTNNDESIWPGRNWNLPSSLPITIDQELISPACWNHFQFFLNELQNMELWALKMYDATGKLGSGVLRGNSAQLGDYDGCVEISESQNDIQGQYCLASLFLDKRNSSKLDQNVLDLIQSHRAMHSTPDDIDIKIAPSFSELLWGLCVPSSCSVNEVENIFSHYLMKYNSTDTGLNIRMRMKSNSCQVQKKPYRLTTSGAVTLLIYATVISAIAFATFSDYTYFKKDTSRTEQNPETFWKKIVMSFSLYSTIPDLISTKLDDGEITCVHGIRFLFSLLIFFSHKAVFGLFVLLTNRTVIAEVLQGSWTMMFRAFWNVVDTFVILSGVLTSYYNFKKFTPVFIMTTLTIKNFGHNIFTGPLAIHVTDDFVDKCNNIWKSVFYISNIDGINDMCYPPSHQVITDMQIYLLSPFIITALWKWKKYGLFGIILSIAILTIYKGAIIYFGNYPIVIYYGITIKKIAESGNQLYLNPLHRLTPYLSGLLLGYILNIQNIKYYTLSSVSLSFF
ncbi:nose resistant to fluoxetine protein 6-like [Lycorma delicatula]|uniref:nose resistant to fluoxetine protein 6-like n=1 Tax=Lycorma delicatula TaxID=130591 RepID=UPI003F519288